MRVPVAPSGDRILDDFQRRVSRAFEEIPVSPLDKAVVLESIAVKAATATTFSHDLGRVHQGVLVVRRTGDVRVWEEGDLSPGRVTLRSNVDATVSVLVF